MGCVYLFFVFHCALLCASSHALPFVITGALRAVPRPALTSFFIGYRQFETPMALFRLVKIFFANPVLPDAPRPTGKPSNSGSTPAAAMDSSVSPSTSGEFAAEAGPSQLVQLSKKELRTR
jgi:hypothetical protein